MLISFNDPDQNTALQLVLNSTQLNLASYGSKADSFSAMVDAAMASATPNPQIQSEFEKVTPQIQSLRNLVSDGQKTLLQLENYQYVPVVPNTFIPGTHMRVTVYTDPTLDSLISQIKNLNGILTAQYKTVSDSVSAFLNLVNQQAKNLVAAVTTNIAATGTNTGAIGSLADGVSQIADVIVEGGGLTGDQESNILLARQAIANARSAVHIATTLNSNATLSLNQLTGLVSGSATDTTDEGFLSLLKNPIVLVLLFTIVTVYLVKEKKK